MTASIQSQHGPLDGESANCSAALCSVPVNARSILNQLPGIVWVLDSRGVFLLSEGRGLPLIGLAPGEVVGRSIESLYGDQPTIMHLARLAMAGEAAYGSVPLGDTTFDVCYSPLYDSRGQRIGATGLAIDVSRRVAEATQLRLDHDRSRRLIDDQAARLLQAESTKQRELSDRQRVEHEFRKQASLLQSVLDAIGDGIAVVDCDGNFLQMNPQGRAILGSGPTAGGAAQWANTYGMYCSDQETLCPADELPLARAMHGERVEQAELYLRNENLPEPRWLSVTATPWNDEQGQPAGAVAVFRDITAVKQAEQSLRAERKALEYMVDAFERDRQLTAYDLHDGMVQQVTGAKLQLEAYRHRLHEATGAPPPAELDAVVEALRQAIDEARRLISGLRPPVIDEQGVAAAIDVLVSQHMGTGTCEIVFEHNLEARRFAPLVESTVFRVVQEALNNVIKHSGADRVEIRLMATNDSLRVEVTDNGCGFDPDQVSQNRFGLRGIRERARLLNGTARFESAPGQGARVAIEFPLPQAIS